MTQVISLTPLFSQSIGFDRFNDLFKAAFTDIQSNQDTYPPYNIEKWGDNEYIITMAVAGINEKNIDVTMQQGTLKVSGKALPATKGKITHLYQGIPEGDFSKSFSLADHMQVQDATLKDGLLQIRLTQEIPDAQKPRMVPINVPAALEASSKSEDAN